MKNLIWIVLLCLSASAWAGYDEGFAAYNKEDYATALKEWQSLAEQGNAIAQLNLGAMYAIGQGVPKNDKEAVKWWRKAAEQSNAQAQLFLGAMYEDGQGVQKNDEEAVRWERKAAEQGFVTAIANLGWYTANGWGTEKNLVEGERLLKLASSKGHDWAKEKLKWVQESMTCLKNASTLLFGEALNCTSKTDLRRALKNAGLKVIREEDGYWYDQYDSSAVLEGTSELSVAYIQENFARAFYRFNSSMDAGKVIEVRNIVVSKYGQPASSSGNPSVGEVSYTWNLKDGIKVVVARGWPDTTVFLSYIHPANFAAMNAELGRQEQETEAEKHRKQNKAF